MSDNNDSFILQWLHSHFLLGFKEVDPSSNKILVNKVQLLNSLCTFSLMVHRHVKPLYRKSITEYVIVAAREKKLYPADVVALNKKIDLQPSLFENTADGVWWTLVGRGCSVETELRLKTNEDWGRESSGCQVCSRYRLQMYVWISPVTPPDRLLPRVVMMILLLNVIWKHCIKSLIDRIYKEYRQLMREKSITITKKVLMLELI